MTSALCRTAMVAAVGLASLAPATASAESSVSYANRSGKVLHLYYAVAPHGADIHCRDLVSGGVVQPDERWRHFVPSEHWTWVRFVEDPRDGGCASSPRYEVRYSGNNYGYQAAIVW